MISIPSGARVWLVTGHTDMRKGFDGLALIVQETLRRDPHSGHLFVFRGRRGSLIKCLWSDGQGSRRGGGWNWVGVVSGLFNPNDSGVGALERRPRHDEGYHEGGGCGRRSFAFG